MQYKCRIVTALYTLCMLCFKTYPFVHAVHAVIQNTSFSRQFPSAYLIGRAYRR